MKSLNWQFKLIWVLALVGSLLACAPKGDELKSWLHEETGSYSASFSPDGKYLLTGSISGFGRVWELSNNRVLFSVQHEDNDQGGIIAAAFSANNRVLVALEQNGLSRWQIPDGRLVGFWQLPRMNALTITPQGRFALIAMEQDNEAILFDMASGEVRQTLPHNDSVHAVAISPDERFAVTGSDDFFISYWSLQSGERLWSKSLGYKVAHLNFNADGTRLLANAYNSPAYILDPQSGKTLLTLDKPRLTVVSSDFSPNGRKLAIGRALKGIEIYDVATGQRLQYWQPPVKESVQPNAATILALRFIDNQQLLSESSIGLGQLWRVQ